MRADDVIARGVPCCQATAAAAAGGDVTQV